MKRINWLKTICLSAMPIVAATPIVAMSTSCAVTSMQIDSFTFATLKSAVDGNKTEFNSFTSSTIKFKDLLIGHKGITSGNYILIIGSNTMSSTCTFFTKNGNIRRKSDWFNQYFIDSALYDAVKEDVEGKEKVPFTFFNVVDYCPKEYYDKKGKRLYLSTDGKSPNLDYINPYRKWKKDLITTTYNFNSIERSAKLGGTYEWDKDSVTENDYIRNDAAAVAYRTFNDLGAKLWPVDEKATPKRSKTFNTSDGDGSRLVIFKEGKLVHIDDLPAGKALANLISTNFTKDPEKKQ